MFRGWFSVKMSTMLEECTTEEQRSVMRFFCGQKGLNAKDIHETMFLLFRMGSVCRVERFTAGGKRFADDEEAETGERKWLRRQSKHFYAVGFDALVKRWDKCTNVGGGYVEKCVFFSGFEYHMFHVLHPFCDYLLTSSYNALSRRKSHTS
jgi:hypothetical protein